MLAYPYGILMVAAVVVVANILRFIAYQLLMHRLIAISFKDILGMHIPAIIISLAVVVGITATRWLLIDLAPSVLLPLEIIIGGLAFSGLILVKPQRGLKGVMIQVLTRVRGENHPNWWHERLLYWYSTRILSM